MDGEPRLRAVEASRKASAEAKMIDVSSLDKHLEAAQADVTTRL